MTYANIPIILKHATDNDAPPVDNDRGYKSLKLFGKEYYAQEKGSAVRGLLYAVPGAAAGAIGGALLAKKMPAIYKRMPASIQKAMRNMAHKTNPATYIKPEIMNNPHIDKMFGHIDDIPKEEIYEELMRTVADPRLRAGLAGAAAGGMTAGTVGDFYGGIKGVNKVETQEGYVPSTKGQYAGRTAASFITSLLAGAAGLAMGEKITRMIPKATGNGAISRMANVGRYVAGHAVPTIALPYVSAPASEYVTSRYLQNHQKATTKTAEERAYTPEEIRENRKKALGYTSMAGGGIGLYNVQNKGLITGRETLTHVTDVKNVDSILRTGLDPNRALDPNNLTSKVGLTPEQMKGKVYLSRGQMGAQATRAGMEMNNMDINPKTLKAKVPTWMLNEVDNPELRGTKNFKEWNKWMNDNAFLNMNWVFMPQSQRKATYDQLGRKGTATIQGGVGPEYFVKSDKYKRVNIPEIISYAKHKPARFAGGVALGAASIAALGYGASKLMPKASPSTSPENIS